MKYFYKSKIILALSVIFSFALANEAKAQCTIEDLAPEHCADAVPVFLSGSPGGGTFSGPGVSGSLFDPSVAGVGIHTITYEYFPGGNRFYIKSNIGDPWGSTTNNQAMDLAFGVGEWTLENFESVDVGDVFVPTTSFVYLDGSQNQSIELKTFLDANISTIEAWVNSGGTILINAAPNEGGDIAYGFGGVSLDYPSVYLASVNAADPGHLAFDGPAVPTSTSMTGTSYCHGRILGPGLTNVLVSGSDVGLAEKAWGDGYAMFGSMTTANWHNPDPAAENWRSNILAYLDGLNTFDPCTVTQDVEVLDSYAPAIVASSDVEELCLGDAYTLTASGADEFYWGGGIVDGEAITPESAGTFTHILTGVSGEGCVGIDEVTIVVHEIPFVDAGIDQAQCVGMEVTLAATGALTYTWSPAITDGEAFVVMDAGTTTYTVTGTDMNDCQDTDEVVVTGYGVPVITAVVTGEYVGYDGAIDITVTGGSGSYAYAWSHGPTTEDVTGLTAGSYNVVVDDIGVDHGICQDVDSVFVITSFVGVKEFTENNLVVYPSPTTDNVTIAYSGSFNYELTALNGDVVVSGSAVDQEVISVEEFAAGTYLINVTSNNKKTTVQIIKQ